MSFSEAVDTCLFDKWSKISGRASRAEFWWFHLFIFLYCFFMLFMSLLIMVADGTSGTIGILDGICGLLGGICALLVMLLSTVISIVIIVSHICVTIRRLHDINCSGWWLLLILIPYLGSIISFADYVELSNLLAMVSVFFSIILQLFFCKNVTI